MKIRTAKGDPYRYVLADVHMIRYICQQMLRFVYIEQKEKRVLCIYTKIKIIFLIFNGSALYETRFQTPYERR